MMNQCGVWHVIYYDRALIILLFLWYSQWEKLLILPGWEKLDQESLLCSSKHVKRGYVFSEAEAKSPNSEYSTLLLLSFSSSVIDDETDIICQAWAGSLLNTWWWHTIPAVACPSMFYCVMTGEEEAGKAVWPCLWLCGGGGAWPSQPAHGVLLTGRDCHWWQYI